MLKHYKFIFSWTFVILWMVTIFYLSSQVAEQSSGLSEGLTKFLLHTFELIAPNYHLDLNLLHYLVRKMSHFIAYFILAIFLFNAWTRSNITGYKGVYYALIISILYAITDEIHQTFVPGRSGEWKDVCIDSAGAIVGIVIYLGLARIMKKKIKS